MADLTDEQRDSGGEPMEALMGAVKVAAATAAVGAAAAAAKALATRNHDDEEPEEAEAQEQEQEEPQEPVAEQEEPEEEHDELEEQPENEEEEEPVEGAALGDAQSAAGRAREQLEELLGKPVESVSSLERTHDGWVVALEVVELQRIPESTDVLASYELELDGDLNFRRYQQARRYTRSQADRGDES
jgi:type IV secretory pathway VirB10-like protein